MSIGSEHTNYPTRRPCIVTPQNFHDKGTAGVRKHSTDIGIPSRIGATRPGVRRSELRFWTGGRQSHYTVTTAAPRVEEEPVLTVEVQILVPPHRVHSSSVTSGPRDP